MTEDVLDQVEQLLKTDMPQVVVVCAAMIDRYMYGGNNVLLTKRNQPNIPEAHGKWQLPGGKVEPGEEPQDTLRREMLEELNVQVHAPIQLLPHIESTLYVPEEGEPFQALVLCYLVPFWGGIIENREPDKTLDWALVDMNQLINVSEAKEFQLPGTDKFISWALWWTQHLV